MTEHLYGLAKDIEERAADEIASILGDIARRLVDKQGRAPGDVQYGDIDVVRRYSELDQSGALVVLGGINPELTQRMRREFDEAYLRVRTVA